jgi:murein DD-endopeptidase MepM/ murein hydrolase activator NlpD
MDEERSLIQSTKRTLQRVAGDVLGGQTDHDLRWQILVIIGRYTSHIAIISVAALAIILAGVRLNANYSTNSNNVVTDTANPNAPPRTGSAGPVLTGQDTAGVLTSLDPNVPLGANNIASSRDLYLLFNQQNYAVLANQDDGLLTRFALPQVAKQVEERRSIFTYTVQPGDTIDGISSRFGLQPSTLAWSNAEVEQDPDHLSLGQVLNILPVDGVFYKVLQGDTLDSVAKKFKAKIEDIVTMPLNNLGSGANLVAGATLIIPNGVKPFVPKVVELPIASSSQGPGAIPRPAQARPQAFGQPRAATGLFSYPLGGYILSQNYWWGHRGLDMAIQSGTPIRASDNGYVQYSGWSTVGYGYLVVINHNNGFTTWYAHMVGQPYVQLGQPVARGQVIGLVGSTGRSTGPHLHFEIRRNGVQENPFIYLR